MPARKFTKDVGHHRVFQELEEHQAEQDDDADRGQDAGDDGRRRPRQAGQPVADKNGQVDGVGPGSSL